MEIKLNLVRTLIEDEAYDAAISILSKNYDGKDQAYLLSLLYRYQHDYDSEQELIEKVLPQYPDWLYLQERKNWLDRPIFHIDPSKSRTVPRNVLQLEKDPERIPQMSTLEQLGIVTCASHECMNWLVESLESIQATQTYSHIPIFIFDMGLTDDEKHYLHKRFFMEKFITPDFSQVPDFWKNSKMALANYTYVFFDEYVEKEYLLHIESDTWIQDDSGLDSILQHAEHNGIAGCYNISLLAYYRNSSILKKWKKHFITEVNRFKRYGPWQLNSIKEQVVKFLEPEYSIEEYMDLAIRHKNSPWYGRGYLCYAFEEQLLHLLHDKHGTWVHGPHIHNVCFWDIGLPITDHNGVYRNPETYEIITSIHVNGLHPGIKNHQAYSLPTLKTDGPLNTNELGQHLSFSKDICRFGSSTNIPDGYAERISPHFRTYPVRDRELIGEIKKVLI